MMSGKLRHVLTVQYQTGISDDGFGGAVPTWGTFATVRAEQRPLYSRDVMSAKAGHGEAVVKYVIRYLPGLTSAMRIVEDGTTYEIVGQPASVGGVNKWQEVLCKSVGGGA